MRKVRKKLTITVGEDVYAGLYQVVGRGRISRFIESLLRPHVVQGHQPSATGIGLVEGMVIAEDAAAGPVVVGGRGSEKRVLLTVEEYLRLVHQDHSIAELLAEPNDDDIDFEPPRLGDEIFREPESL